ncbi:MAG: hypothetical protein II180_03975 [Proteobacteria bacterium]|nr:hypothetical protein [Pseudomonadota bacterium]
MRILAVVEDRLVAPLREGIGGNIKFCSAWADVVPARLGEFDYVFVSSSVIEAMADPLAVWAVSSQLHYFKRSAVYIDASEKVERVVASLYPQIKLVSYEGVSEQLILELGSVAPELFFYRSGASAFGEAHPGAEDHNVQHGRPGDHAALFERSSNTEVLGLRPGDHAAYRSSENVSVRRTGVNGAVPGHSVDNSVRRTGVNGAVPGHLVDNAVRRSGENVAVRGNSVDNAVRRSGENVAVRGNSVDNAVHRTIENATLRGRSSDNAVLRSSDNAVLRSSDNAVLRSGDNAVLHSSDNPALHPNTLRMAGLGNENGTKAKRETLRDFELNDNSGISGVSEVLGLFDTNSGSKVRQGREDISAMGRRRMMVDGSRKFTSDPNENSRLTADEIVLKRSVRDVMLGNIEFGKLVRIITLIMNLGLTGILEMMNSARCVKLEFRQGKPYISCSESLLAGALCWANGEFNFNSSQMLAANSQTVDIKKLIANAVNEQYPLNSVLRALEKEFNSVVMRTNCFEEKTHPADIEKWWERCDGKCKLSEIMMSAGMSMDAISRDIYRSWLCDEICFLESETSKQVRIEFDTAKMRVSGNTEVVKASNSSLGKSSLGDNAGKSHLDTIRADLMQAREKFDTMDGYGILGLKPGCGTKALDEAYYAWINRYHTDRFVRFNEPSFIKLANELLMLMNAAYSKLSKRERQGGVSSSSASHEGVQRTAHPSGEMPAVAEVSSRIGAGRNRVNTIHSFDGSTGNPEFDNLSKELKNMQFCENKSLKQAKDRPRTRIRPASVAVDVDTEQLLAEQQAQGPVKRMSDILKSRGISSGDDGDTPVHEDALSSSPNLPKAPWMPANTTPEQQFATAKKKLALGLAQEAHASLAWAIEKDPENIEYQAYFAYADFLVTPDNREISLAKVRDIYEQLKASATGMQINAEMRSRLFAALYFIGKMELAAERYSEAKDALQQALKFNPNDVDAQRSLRYAAMQLDKQPAADEEKAKGGIMSVIKRLGSIKL